MIFDDCIAYNLMSKIGGVIEADLEVIFVVSLWWLWRWKNDRIFNDVSKSKEQKLNWIRSQSKEIMEKAIGFH